MGDEGEFEWTLGDGDGQGGLACCNSWGHKESDMTEQLNWTNWLYFNNKLKWKTPNIILMYRQDGEPQD